MMCGCRVYGFDGRGRAFDEVPLGGSFVFIEHVSPDTHRHDDARGNGGARDGVGGGARRRRGCVSVAVHAVGRNNYYCTL